MTMTQKKASRPATVGFTLIRATRIRFNIGLGVQGHVPVDVDYDCDFPASDREAWQREYDAPRELPAGGGIHRSAFITRRLWWI